MKRRQLRWGLLASAIVGLGIATAVLVKAPAGAHTSAVRPAAATGGQIDRHVRRWAQEGRRGTVQLTGQVPLTVAHRTAQTVSRHPLTSEIGLNFGFALRNHAALDALIQQEATTHHYLSRPQLYARVSPPEAQVDALRSWLLARGFRITHVGADRMAITAYATTATIEKTLHVKIEDFIRPSFTYHGLKVQPYQFYANTTAPILPARFGVQTVSGLSDVDRFFTSYQLASKGAQRTTQGAGNPLGTDVRSGGYFPSDLRAMYDVAGHGYDGTGQTLGFTLWGAGERQAAMTAFATATGDQPITVDTPCVATGNSPTVPSSCVDADRRGRPSSDHPREREHEQPVRRQRRDGARHRAGARHRDARRDEVLRRRLHGRAPRRLRALEREPAATVPTSASKMPSRTRRTTRRCTASATAGRSAATPSGATPIRS